MQKRAKDGGDGVKKWLAALIAALCLLTASLAGAEGVRIYSFSVHEPPAELMDTLFALPAEESVVTFTFAGDCTLGGEPEINRRGDSFAKTVEREGFSYPFSGLAPLFATDDVTLVNLEGVLSASAAGRAEKEFTFIGDPSFTRCLTLGSVECVTLANNHTMDFGQRGYRDTCDALANASVGWTDAERVLVIEKDGYRIGMTSSAFTLSAADEKRLAAQMEALGQLGCLAIVHHMHAGQEYADQHNRQQQDTAETVLRLGAQLVVGHHPHVPQDVDSYGDGLVVYSLGNCCFGGNLNPSRRDGVLLRVSFHFGEDRLREMQWSLHPIAISGVSPGNDFCPQLLQGGAAQQVIHRMEQSGNIPLLPFENGAGAVQPAIVYQ